MSDVLNTHPIIIVFTLTIMMMVILFAIAWELPQAVVRKISVFWREQKLFKLFPRAVSILFEKCFPVNQSFVLPDIGDYIRPDRSSNKGYTLLKCATWEHVSLTWEQVVELSKGGQK